MKTTQLTELVCFVLFTEKDDSGKVECIHGNRLRYRGFAVATYIVLGGRKIEVNNNQLVKIGDGYRNQQITVQVCFCEQSHFPTGCVAKNVRC